MNFDELTDKNFPLFAAKYYENPHCIGLDEFTEDVNRIKYLKRLFSKYESKGELKERLILNHLVILYNVFETQALTKMLYFKLSDYDRSLSTFLYYLGYLPTSDETILDIDIMNVLRDI